MQIALSTYSMSRRMEEGTLNQLTCIAKAKEMGFDAIEFVDIWPHDGSSREDYAKRLREECERLGVPAVNYAVGADFLRCEDLPAEIARVQHEVEIAALLGEWFPTENSRYLRTPDPGTGYQVLFDGNTPVSYHPVP